MGRFFAVLKSLSRILMCRFSSEVSQGLSECRTIIVFLGIACEAADITVSVKFLAAVSMSWSSMVSQSVVMSKSVSRVGFSLE